MTKPKSEIDPIWSEAQKAKDDAIKARAAASRAAAVVLVCHETLSAAQEKAADLLVAAQEAEAKALDGAKRAREAVEKELGLEVHEDEKKTEAVTVDKEEV